MEPMLTFPTKRVRALVREEATLLDRLRNSANLLSLGVWAEPGDPTGVTLLRDQHCLGLWVFEVGAYQFFSPSSHEALLTVNGLEEAHRQSILRVYGPSVVGGSGSVSAA
jgi:hypothetical protein